MFAPLYQLSQTLSMPAFIKTSLIYKTCLCGRGSEASRARRCEDAGQDDAKGAPCGEGSVPRLPRPPGRGQATRAVCACVCDVALFCWVCFFLKERNRLSLPLFPHPGARTESRRRVTGAPAQPAQVSPPRRRSRFPRRAPAPSLLIWQCLKLLPSGSLSQ